MDFPPNPIEKSGYTLEFSDEFDGFSLNDSKWFPYMLPHWSSLERSKASYEVGGGSLRLRIEPNQERWIDGGDRASNLQTAHYSGQFRYDSRLLVTTEIPTMRGYTPQFGYFEIRLKALPVIGYHTALWMIGFDEQNAGEIRCFELHGINIGAERSRVDTAILRWDDPNLNEEIYEDWLPINAAEYHIYAVEWLPERVDFYVDNHKFRSIAQSPQYPLQFMLGLYERTHELRAEDSHLPYPRACEVDYFRGYKPVDGY